MGQGGVQGLGPGPGSRQTCSNRPPGPRPATARALLTLAHCRRAALLHPPRAPLAPLAPLPPRRRAAALPRTADGFRPSLSSVYLSRSSHTPQVRGENRPAGAGRLTWPPRPGLDAYVVRGGEVIGCRSSVRAVAQACGPSGRNIIQPDGMCGRLGWPVWDRRAGNMRSAHVVLETN